MVTSLVFSIVLLMTSGCTTKEFHLGWYDKCLPSTIVEYEKVYPIIPAEKLQCSQVPKPGIYTKQSEVAYYIVDLYKAGTACQDNLNFTRGRLDEFQNGKGTSDAK